MLDPLLLKNDLDSLKDNLKRRNLDVDLEQLIELDESRRKLRFEAEKLRADQKLLGKDIANAEPKEKDALLEKASQISENVKKILSIELFNSAQAIDLKKPLKTSNFLHQFISIYRNKVEFISEDKLMHNEINSTLDFIESYNVNEGLFIF